MRQLSPHVHQKGSSKSNGYSTGHLPCYTPATKASTVDCTSEETDTSLK